MKFALIVPRYHTNNLGWVEGLLERGHEVHVGVFRREPTEDYGMMRPIDLQGLGLDGWKRKVLDRTRLGGEPASVKATVNMHDWLRSIKPDACVVRLEPNAKSLLLLESLKRKGKTKLIGYTQQPLASTGLKASLFLTMLALANVPVISPVRTKPARDDVAVHQGSGIRYWIPFACSVAKSGNAPEGTHRLVTVGKFRDRKRIVELVDELGQLPRQVRETFHLTIIGESLSVDEHQYESLVRRKIAEHGLDNQVRVITNVSHACVLAEMRNCHVFVLNSIHEMAAVSIAEALSSGCAVVCHEDNGTADYVTSAKAGIIFNDRDVRLNDALVKIITDQDVRSTFQRNALSFGRTTLDPEIVAGLIENVAQSV